MIDTNLAIQYYGYPPYYRNLRTGRIEPLPFRVRLLDGTTRTDPSQWALDEYVLNQSGYQLTEVMQEDIDYKKPSLEQLKQNKLEELQTYWRTLLNNGWQTPEGWKLGLDINDVTLLTGAFLLLKEGVNLGITSTTTIIDTENISHTVDLATMTQLMLNYGNYRSSISLHYSNLYNSILSATNESELNLIIIGDNTDGSA